MKIAIITDGLMAGGAERQAVLTAATLSRLGERVALISWSQVNQCQDLLSQSGVRLILVQRTRSKLARLMRLRRLLRDGRYEVVHAFKGTANLYGRLAAWLAGVPRIFAGHRSQSMLPPAWRLVNRLLDRISAGWIVNSETVRQVVHRMGVPCGRIHIVRNVVELHHFDIPHTPAQARQELEIPADCPVVSIVANMIPVKNPGMFFRMARRVADAVPNVTFVSAGEPEPAAFGEQIRAMARELGVLERCRFLGHCPRIPLLLRATDVLVLTSRTEGVPNALIEAGAAGVPAVSTDNGGAREVLVDGRTGFVVPVDDDRQMAERVIELLRDPAMRQCMGQAARQAMAERFSPQALARTIMPVYRGEAAVG